MTVKTITPEVVTADLETMRTLAALIVGADRYAASVASDLAAVGHGGADSVRACRQEVADAACGRADVAAGKALAAWYGVEVPAETAAAFRAALMKKYDNRY